MCFYSLVVAVVDAITACFCERFLNALGDDGAVAAATAAAALEIPLASEQLAECPSSHQSLCFQEVKRDICASEEIHANRRRRRRQQQRAELKGRTVFLESTAGMTSRGCRQNVCATTLLSPVRPVREVHANIEESDDNNYEEKGTGAKGSTEKQKYSIFSSSP